MIQPTLARGVDNGSTTGGMAGNTLLSDRFVRVSRQLTDVLCESREKLAADNERHRVRQHCILCSRACQSSDGLRGIWTIAGGGAGGGGGVGG